MTHTRNGRSVAMTRSGSLASTTDEWLPEIVISEHDRRLVVHINLPGVKPKDLNVTVAGGVLTIRGQRGEMREADYLHCERETRVFTRAIRLPEGAKAEQIETTYRDGVLEVTLPRE